MPAGAVAASGRMAAALRTMSSASTQKTQSLVAWSKAN
jgi:hypothetical protein